MPEELKDMSETCSFMYKEYYYKAHVEHTMSQKEWEAWYSEHCGKCCYMSVICMYGEK